MVVFMHLNYSFALLAQTEKVAPTQNPILPADFPKYTDTGNPAADNDRYNAAKQAWIAANPALYVKMNEQSESTPQNNIAPITQTQNQDKVESAPHYPIVPTTGNVAVDEKAHIGADSPATDKSPEQPIITSSFGTNPSKKKIEPMPSDTMVANNTPKPLPKVSVPIRETWILTGIKPINNKRSTVELSELTQKFAAQYFDINTLFIVHQDDSFCLHKRDEEIMGKILYDNQKTITLLIKNDFCENCYKDISFKELQKVKDLWVWQINSEWESAPDIVFEITLQVK